MITATPYFVTSKVWGYTEFTISPSENETDAKCIAEDMISEMEFGPLEDVEWEVLATEGDNYEDVTAKVWGYVGEQFPGYCERDALEAAEEYLQNLDFGDNLHDIEWELGYAEVDSFD